MLNNAILLSSCHAASATHHRPKHGLPCHQSPRYAFAVVPKARRLSGVPTRFATGPAPPGRTTPAGLVPDAQPLASGVASHGQPTVHLDASKAYRGMLGDLPVELAGNWVQVVNAEQGESELTAIHQSIARGTLLGGETWAEQAARLLHLGNTSRQGGRPHKVETSAILMR